MMGNQEQFQVKSEFPLTSEESTLLERIYLFLLSQGMEVKYHGWQRVTGGFAGNYRFHGVSSAPSRDVIISVGLPSLGTYARNPNLLNWVCLADFLQDPTKHKLDL